MLLLSTVAACLPSQPDDPVAVRMQGDDEAVVLYTGCRPESFVAIDLFLPEENYIPEDEVPIWEVRWNPPVDVDRFVVGRVDHDGVETIHLDSPLVDDAMYSVRLVTADDRWLNGTVELNVLRTGDVYFGAGYLTEEEFAEETSCGSEPVQ